MPGEHCDGWCQPPTIRNYVKPQTGWFCSEETYLFGKTGGQEISAIAKLEFVVPLAQGC
jgi:hypothetical protein